MNNLWKQGLSLTLVLPLATLAACAGDETPPAFDKLRLGKKAQMVQDPELLTRALQDIAAEPWKPAVQSEQPRGPAGAVYPIVGPAVVVVRTDKGHGTGVLIDSAGWLLTNHHVIAQAGLDPKSGARQATIFLGKLKDGFMEMEKTSLPALVYKSSPDKDLALLRLQVPAGSTREFPALKLAQEIPGAGKDCVALGHPGSAVLWTVRSGEIAGLGQWPKDMTEMLMLRLSDSTRDRAEVHKFLSKAAQTKIILSNCGINFGDSGGPLVNAKGEVIGITFAMPKKGYEGTAPFAYHVHLDEVKEFLKDRPKQPAPVIPDPWPGGLYHELLDLDGDGTADALAFTKELRGPITGILFDLRQDNKLRPLDRPPGDVRSWRFQLALHLQPRPAAFYDTDLDGKIDLMLTQADPRDPVQFLKLEKGRWTSEERSSRPLVDQALFSDPVVRDRLGRIMRRLREITAP